MTAPTPIRKATERVYTMGSGLVVRLHERQEKMADMAPRAVSRGHVHPDMTYPVREVSFDVADKVKLDHFEAQMLCNLISSWMGGELIGRRRVMPPIMGEIGAEVLEPL